MNFLDAIKRIIRKIIFPESNERFWRWYEKALAAKGIVRGYYTIKIRKAARKGGSSLPLSELINRFEMPHGIAGIFVSQGARIGKNCVIFQQVTIGSNTLPGSKSYGAPVIGDNVYIGAGAKIIGGVTIGDHVRIGANCVVVEDIAPYSTVVMNKPRVISRASMDNTFSAWGEENDLRGTNES